MKYVAVDDSDPEIPGVGVEQYGLSDPLETTDVAINRYRIPSGEGFPAGLHAHADQEEMFVVLEGEATFEVLEPRSEAGRTSDETIGSEVVVGEGETVRFAPGEFQSGRNDSEEDLVALALGAPRDSEDVRLPVDCPECGHGDLRLDTDGEVVLVCPACGAVRVPAPCPDCGHEDLRMTLGDRVGEGNATDGTVVVCSGCGATFETPPFRT